MSQTGKGLNGDATASMPAVEAEQETRQRNGGARQTA